MTNPNLDAVGPFHSLGLPYGQQLALERAGYHSIEAIVAATDDDLAAAGMNDEHVATIRQAAGPVLHSLNRRAGDALRAAGYMTDAQLAAATDDDLRAIEGVGDATLATIRQSIPAPAAAPAETSTADAAPGPAGPNPATLNSTVAQSDSPTANSSVEEA